MAHHQPADGLGIRLRQLGVDVYLAPDLQTDLAREDKGDRPLYDTA